MRRVSAAAPQPLSDDRARPPASTEALIGRTILLLGAAVALGWFLFLARQALLLIYIGGLLAIGFSPLVRMIERQRVVPVGARRLLPRWLAILTVYVTILALLVGVGVLTLPVIVGQAQGLWAQFPEMSTAAQRFLLRYSLTRQVTVEKILQDAPATDMLGTITATVWTLLGGIFGIVTILILTFYFLVESEALVSGFVRLFPHERRADARTMCTEITTKVSSWLACQFILAAVIGVTTAVVLGVLGVPYFYVLALIAAFGELIPYVGPLVAALPGIAVAAGSSWQFAIGIAAYYLVQQQLESNVLVPRLMGPQVGLSAAGVLVALLIGGSLLGVLGALLAVPTVAIVQVLLQTLVPNGE